MKKISMIAMSGFFACGAALAGFDGPTAAAPVAQHKGGFVNPSETIVTVSQVNEMRDDVYVVVVGRIAQSMGDEKFLFEDSTGSIAVEIDDDNWGGQTVTPNDTVKLRGNVDRGIFKTEIEVDEVEKI